MNIKSKNFLIITIITFVILFLMNYLGNSAEDRIFRALLTAAAGVAGLTIGLWFVYKNKNDDTKHNFD